MILGVYDIWCALSIASSSFSGLSAKRAHFGFTNDGGSADHEKECILLLHTSFLRSILDVLTPSLRKR